MNYKAFFLTVDKKLEWTNKSFESDQEAIQDAKSKLRSGESVKVYATIDGQLEGRVVLDTEAGQ